jgi:4-diphosphocytidyl-2-C-methyl-D-erythritol kinase
MRCPAKLNLSLHVLGKRPDGYSTLDSVVALLDWYDALSIRPSLRANEASESDVYFTSNDPTLQALGEDNLVFRGIRAVQQQHRQNHPHLKGFPPVEVYLEKHLPYQAGLGSASSNAACAIRQYHTLVCQQWSELTPLSDEQLHELGAEIGSDVPLFLKKTPLLHLQGRGEHLDVIAGNSQSFRGVDVLVLKSARIAISTKDAYAWVHEAKAYSTPKALLIEGLQSGVPLKALQPAMHNDFEAVVFEKHPALALQKKALLDKGAFHAMLCGSGSAVVGFFEPDRLPSEKEQEQLQTRLGVKAWQTAFL